MPELPEVETTCRGIAPYLVNNVITDVTIRNSQLRWPVDPKILQLQRQRVLSVQRRAKYLLIEFQSGWLIIHLGMSGHLRILQQSVVPEKHDHIDLRFSDGIVLRYTDPRRFGAWLWTDDLNQFHLFQHLGPEPLSKEFNLQWLINQAKNRKVPVKKWIMDNKTVVGVGNIYANEALFNAKIHPERLVDNLSTHELEQLRIEIMAVLSHAIEQGGTTLRDFLGSDGKPGYFVQKLKVYGRAGQTCVCCNATIQSKMIGQRNSFYCEKCQN